jgi:hypothetical protein
MAGPSASYPFPVQIGTLPREGSKAIIVSLNWISAPTGGIVPTFQVNLLQQFQTGQFSSVQSVYVDNSSVPYSVTLVCNESGQTLQIPPFSQGTFPLLAETAPSFSASMRAFANPSYGTKILNCTTDLYFLNTPQKPFLNRLPIYGQNFGTYFANFSMTSTQAPLTSTSGGIGLTALGPNMHYLINYISLTVIANNDAAGGVTVTLQEYGHSGPYILWLDGFYCQPAVPGIVYSKIMQFDTPILTYDPLNSLELVMSAVPASGFAIELQINAGIVIIE